MGGLEEHLKRRALVFFRNAMRNFDDGDYDVSMFNLEQAVQLYIKYLIYLKLGDFRKSHDLKVLFKDLLRLYGDCGLKDFYRVYSDKLRILSDAYILSRYIPVEYDREEVQDMINVVKKLMEVFKCLENMTS